MIDSMSMYDAYIARMLCFSYLFLQDQVIIPLKQAKLGEADQDDAGDQDVLLVVHPNYIVES